MSRKEFIELLKKRRIEYRLEEERLVICHNGIVCLQSLKELPEGSVFKNDGSVDLPLLRELPEEAVFENGGFVDLRSLKELPEGTVFENHGNVYLASLEELPKGTIFENQGTVLLPTGNYIYRGEQIELIEVDGWSMLIRNRKQVEDYYVYHASYMGGGPLEELTQVRIVSTLDGKLWAHGETLRQAHQDLQFKIFSENTDTSEIMEAIQEKGEVTINEYRALTGACRTGVEMFLEENGETREVMPVEEALKLTTGAYGGERFRELLAG